MAKASRPGNQAVAGIAGTSTTSPTYYKSEAAGSAAGSTGKSSSLFQQHDDEYQKYGKRYAAR